MKRQAGLTLLEVAIASTVLAMVMGMTMGILLDSSRAVERMSRRGDLENRGRELLTFGKTVLFTGKFYGTGPTLAGYGQLGIVSSYTELRFQIPVSRAAGDGVIYGFTSDVGIDDPAAAGWTCILRFEADTILRESTQAAANPAQPAASWGAAFPSLPTLSTKVLNLDLNGDGDRLDTFLKGKMQQYIVAQNGTLIRHSTLSDDVILEVVQGAYPYSMEDSATKVREPLWRFVDASGAVVAGSVPGSSGRALVLTVWHGSLDERGKEFPLRKSSDVLRFRNLQQ